jgi:hypothetical protein
MIKRETIEFVESRSPLAAPVTKFGGQPVWIGDPQWPLSKSTGNPMRFIGQIAMESRRMAYVFMTDEEQFVDGTWDPDGGENAVILQPGINTAKTAALTGGPTLYRMVKKLFHKKLVAQPCEFSNLVKTRNSLTRPPSPAGRRANGTLMPPPWQEIKSAAHRSLSKARNFPAPVTGGCSCNWILPKFRSI